MNFNNKAKSLVGFIFLICFLSGCAKNDNEIQRFGQVALIKPADIKHFEGLPGIISTELMEELNKANIQNFSLYLKDLDSSKLSVFRYFEYTGGDFNSEMNRLRNNPVILKWKSSIENTPVVTILPCSESKLWDEMEEVFYFKGSYDNSDAVSVQSYGTVIGLRPKYIDSYSYLHKYTWPEVLNAIERSNIRNYSIYHHTIGESYYLFGHYEYTGNNFSEDMAMIDNDPATIAWLKFTDEICQIPLPTRAEGEWWAAMKELFLAK
ncbi:L-rhamnose mutarotase [Bacteroidota bacterium]